MSVRCPNKREPCTLRLCEVGSKCAPMKPSPVPQPDTGANGEQVVRPPKKRKPRK